jgi:hypothetical protein
MQEPLMLAAPWNSRACVTVNSWCVKLLMFAPPWKSDALAPRKSFGNNRGLLASAGITFATSPALRKWLTMTSPRIHIASLLSALLTLSACSHRISIESINRDPAQFRGKEITVRGRVVNSFATADAGAFEVDDGTGRLWILRDNRNLPSHNSSVTVSGKIEQSFVFAGRNFVIIFREMHKRR